MRVHMWTLATAAALAGQVLAQQPPPPPAVPVPTPPAAAAPVPITPPAPTAPPAAAAPVPTTPAPAAVAAPVQSATPAPASAATAPAPAATTPAAAAVPGKPAAVVNGEPITLAEVDKVIKDGPPSPNPLTEAQRRQLRFDIASDLIDEMLLEQFLRKNGAKIEPAEVDKEIARLQTRMKEQKADYTLADFYRDSGLNESQLRINIVKMLQWAAYVKAHISDADVKRYYDENHLFFDKVTVRASHILLRLPATATEAEKQAARKKLVDLRQEIVAGKIDFAEAAKKHSQCSSAPGGGDLGFFSRKWMMEETFSKAAFDLKVNEVSDVVATSFGVHLIKVTDRRPGQPSDFEKIKEEVRDCCVEELHQALLAEQRKIAKIEINLP